MKKKYSIIIEPLTAVHIGTGEELTPLDYTLAPGKTQRDNSKMMYWKFSPDKIIDRLIKNGESRKLSLLDSYSGAGNMKEMRKFYQENCVLPDDMDYLCDTTAAFRRVYEQNKDKDPVDNASVVNQIYRPKGKKGPVIPGSSFKGAVRTALLNYNLSGIPDKEYTEAVDEFNKEKSGMRHDYRKLNNSLQSFAFGEPFDVNRHTDAKTDPMRSVLFADAAFPVANTQTVGMMKNISYDKANEELKAIDKLQMIAEMIQGTLIGGKASSEMISAIDEDLQHAVIENEKKSFAIDKHISMQEICAACNDFYLQEFNNEYEKFYKPCVDGVKIVNELRQILQTSVAMPHTFIIRIGRWSQVEFVTFEDNFRNPKTPVRKGKQQSYGGTRTVLDYNGEYVPMGWCRCTVKEI